MTRSPVIASPPSTGHAAADESAWLKWILLIIGVVAAGGFAAFLRARPAWLTRTGLPRPVSPPRMFVVLAWQLLVAPALAVSVGALVLVPEVEGQLTLRETALLTLLGQAATFPLVLLWLGLGRMPAEQLWIAGALSRIADSRRSEPRRASTPLKAIGIGVIGLVVGWPIVALTSELSSVVYEFMTGQPAPMIAHKTLEQLAEADPSNPWRAVMIGAVVLIAPIIEEVIYRGSLQACLRGLVRSPWPAILLAAVLFGAMHIGTAAGAAIPGLMVFGLGLGIVYERSGTLLAPMVMHGLFNAGNIAILLAVTGEGR